MEIPLSDEKFVAELPAAYLRHRAKTFCPNALKGLSHLLHVYRFILLEADAAVTPWSRICISHADCVLLVGAEEASPQVGAPRAAP